MYLMIDSITIKELENITYKTQQIHEIVVIQCTTLTEQTSHSTAAITETVDSLKHTIKKVLLTNKVIPEPLAVVIAKVIVFVADLEQELTKKKTPELQQHLKMIFDAASGITRQQLDPATYSDKSDVDLVTNIKTVLANLTGNATDRISVEQTFNRILDKVARREANGQLPVDIMKLVSLIVQSNGDTNKRKELIIKTT
jgi:hypothetical protein